MARDEMENNDLIATQMFTQWNIESAVPQLKKVKEYLTEIYDPENKYVGLSAWNALDTAIDVLQCFQPDPITGLVRCGVCGKSPTYEEFNDGFFDLDRVECRGCGVMVTSACGKSKAKWNATRGYK